MKKPQTLRAMREKGGASVQTGASPLPRPSRVTKKSRTLLTRTALLLAAGAIPVVAQAQNARAQRARTQNGQAARGQSLNRWPPLNAVEERASFPVRVGDVTFTTGYYSYVVALYRVDNLRYSRAVNIGPRQWSVIIGLGGDEPIGPRSGQTPGDATPPSGSAVPRRPPFAGSAPAPRPAPLPPLPAVPPPPRVPQAPPPPPPPPPAPPAPPAPAPPRAGLPALPALPPVPPLPPVPAS